MNSTIQNNQAKQKLSKPLKSIFTFFCLSTSVVLLTPAAVLAINHHPATRLI